MLKSLYARSVPRDLFRFKFLQDARLSPDGKRVVYAVSHTEKTGAGGEADVSALYLLSLEDGETRQLTWGEAVDASPAWSPDGRTIAFLSTRTGKPQLYTLRVDGGEARALTHLGQGVGGGPAWSPDGRSIAFTAGPQELVDYSKPYRVTRHIYRFNGIGPLENALQDLYVLSLDGGEPRRLVHNGCMIGSPAWSPDGKELLYTVSMFPDSFRLFPSLRIATLEGSERSLVEEWGYATSAAWTPDGERVAFMGNPLGLPIGSKDNLWVIARQGGQPVCRTAGLKAHLGGALEGDMPLMSIEMPRVILGKRPWAFVQVQQGGIQGVYRVALDGAEDWSPVAAGERACFPLDTQGDGLLFAASQTNDPLDLYYTAADGSNERRLTHLNADLLAELALPEVEPLAFTAADGVPLEGWYMQPVGGQAPYPTILYIHGGPHEAFGHIFCSNFHLLAGAGFGVLYVNQRGSTGYGDAFATQIIGDWGHLDYLDLMAGVDYAIARGLADAERLGVCGLSGGGNLSCWIVGQTQRFKAAVPENPVTNFVSLYGVSDISPWFVPEELGGMPHEIPEVYRRCSPITYAHRCQTPTLLIQGEADYRCPAEQSEQFYTALKASGCTVEMLRLPNSAHLGSVNGEPLIRRAQNEALLDWMQRYVLGQEPGE